MPSKGECAMFVVFILLREAREDITLYSITAVVSSLYCDVVPSKGEWREVWFVQSVTEVREDITLYCTIVDISCG